MTIEGQTANKTSFRLTASGKWWLVGCGVALVSAFPLGWLDSTTTLVPDHSNIIGVGFGLGLAVAIVGASILWRSTSSWPLKNRVGISVPCAFLSFLAMVMVFLPISNIVQGWIDFQPSKTVTYDGVVIMISRAYQTHGKGRSWNIQTMPIWSNIDITRDDYDFMLSHRSPNDHGTDPDEITSKGYFCAKVTVQRSGDAIRVLHAGGGKLPRGSVIVCPPDIGSRLHI